MFDKRTKQLIEKKENIRHTLVKITNQIFNKQMEIEQLKKMKTEMAKDYQKLQLEIAIILSTYTI